MRAMLLQAQGEPLRLAEVPRPIPDPQQIVLEVRACGVCRTDLHVLDGDLENPRLPLILGHEIVGIVLDKGSAVERFSVGQRIGVPWLGRTCGHCRYCTGGSENLCDAAEFTGYTLDGGYAEFALADQRYCFALPEAYTDAEAAPLLCAGLIGYRSLIAAGNARRLGIYGFGAAAHIIAQVARWQGRDVFAFTKPGDLEGQDFARQIGANWAGGANETPPQDMDAAILFAPVGQLVPQALRHTVKGGTVVCAGIHMSDIPTFPYAILWGERSVRSIANLTRRDGEEFFAVAPQAGVRTEVSCFPLEAANEALDQLRAGRVRGAAVLVNR
ncbi:zinc-dependent alcohol dehydrogenase family protein [Accumulibacter sp.]|uniref:zinc-dependent alcohol dehydrogenase family protein n=1 Tax=Accumulibacter sp. TaxID=2053492 RepID=UPI0025D0DCF7|nr:zinc-dependent alcohol dehydrogenase family protein [Accumulibacter sp.]MCM8595275.1 zinc-dependent alcohol dehydrogenase family protein [Accumulibacter sp.]MCM8627744.1 zinc-dependent alcohol dehydrogenase family protein [Accumulibacter sp.]MDS4049421.1 zinc-dependent alcohol dehydrogenase family protein [Accumulibacter sp.]